MGIQFQLVFHWGLFSPDAQMLLNMYGMVYVLLTSTGALILIEFIKGQFHPVPKLESLEFSFTQLK